MRQLATSRKRIRDNAASLRQDKTRRAYLVMPYRDKMTHVLVQFSDPRLSSRGTVVRASISPGIWILSPFPVTDTTLPTTPEDLADFVHQAVASPNFDAGHPVTVVIRHGRVEVVGF